MNKRTGDFLFTMAVVTLLLIAALLAFRKEANADTRPDQEEKVSHLVLSFGPTLNGDTNPKMAGIGIEAIFNEASLLFECRGIFSSQLNGACALVLSARVETISGLFVRVGAGPAYYFRKDDRVSSNLNANLQAVVGVTNRGWDIGAGYFHYSNAGLVPPNLGRDFIGPVVEIKI